MRYKFSPFISKAATVAQAHFDTQTIYLEGLGEVYRTNGLPNPTASLVRTVANRSFMVGTYAVDEIELNRNNEPMKAALDQVKAIHNAVTSTDEMINSELRASTQVPTSISEVNITAATTGKMMANQSEATHEQLSQVHNQLTHLIQEILAQQAPHDLGTMN